MSGWQEDGCEWGLRRWCVMQARVQTRAAGVQSGRLATVSGDKCRRTCASDRQGYRWRVASASRRQGSREHARAAATARVQAKTDTYEATKEN